MRIHRAVDLACWLGLLALALIVASVIEPRPNLVFLAMSVGQVIGTASLALFVGAIILDLRRAHVLDNSPASPESKEAKSAGGTP